MGTAALGHLRVQMLAALPLARAPSGQRVPGRARRAAQPSGPAAQGSVVRRRGCLLCARESLLTGVAGTAVGIHPPLVKASSRIPSSLAERC